MMNIHSDGFAHPLEMGARLVKLSVGPRVTVHLSTSHWWCVKIQWLLFDTLVPPLNHILLGISTLWFSIYFPPLLKIVCRLYFLFCASEAADRWSCLVNHNRNNKTILEMLKTPEHGGIWVRIINRLCLGMWNEILLLHLIKYTAIKGGRMYIWGRIATFSALKSSCHRTDDESC